MKKIIITVILSFMSMVTFAQSVRSVELPALLDSLDRVILQRVIYAGLERPNHTKAFNVVYGFYDGFTTKGAIMKGRFLEKYHVDYSPNSERMMNLHVSVILCDARGQAYGMFNGYDYYSYRSSYLTQEMIRLGMRHVYCFVNVCGYEAIYWGVGNDGESYVILPAKECTYMVQDCPDEVWDRLFQVHTVFAQEIPTPFQKKDVQKLEKMVLNMYKKATHQRVDGVHVVNVFDVTCNNCDKRETYADTSFVKKLEYGYVKIGCRKYLPSVSLVCDIDNNVVGEWHWNSYSDHAVLYDQSFIDTLYSRHIVHVYRMCKGIETPFLIGVSGDCETYLIDSREYGYKVYPIAECLDLQWNYIIEGHPKLEIDNSPVP